METECEYSYQIGDITIKARIDRLEFLKDGGVSIIDFKTGVAPTIKSVEAFLKPQTLVQGLVFLRQSGQQHIKELPFSKLSTSQIKLAKLKNPELLIQQLETKIENLIRMHKDAIIQT